MKITTNGHQQPLLYWEHLTTAEQATLPTYQAYPLHVSEQFLRYKGKVYPLADFKHIPDYLEGRWRASIKSPWSEWDKWLKQGPGQGLVLRTGDDTDHVVIGSYDETD